MNDARVGELIAVLEDEALGEEISPRYSALQRLIDLRATEAIEPMLRVLETTDVHSSLHDTIWNHLELLGAPVLEPALEQLSKATDPDLRQSLTSILSRLGVRDDRIFEAIRRHHEHDPREAVLYFCWYGDPRGFPFVRSTIEQHELDLQSTGRREPLADLDDCERVVTRWVEKNIGRAADALRRQQGPAS